MTLILASSALNHSQISPYLLWMDSLLTHLRSSRFDTPKCCLVESFASSSVHENYSILTIAYTSKTELAAVLGYAHSLFTLARETFGFKRFDSFQLRYQ